MSRFARCLLLSMMTLVVASVALADGAPWRARRTRGMSPNYIAEARVDPEHWPDEPSSPAEVDPHRLARALHELCGWMPPGRPLRYAEWLVRYGEEFDQDPFLLGALVYERTLGSCRPDTEGEHGELGLTQIKREVYAEQIRRGVLSYQVRMAGEWETRQLAVDRFPFAGPRLARAEENIYFAAALLAAYEDQHLSVDAVFDQVDHRHPVSHFVWGDRVKSDRQEDRVFTARRRLLHYYGAIAAPRPVTRFGIELGSPLDGAPRVVSSGIGASRGGGDRSHRGIDLESLPGEQVRAAADATVAFAGVDLPGHQSHENVAKDGYDAYRRDSLGAGGRFVCLRHDRPDAPDLRTCYMHLETVDVEAGDTVARGDLLGTVGRTGMQSSAAHLHFEVLLDGEVLDGLDVLGDLAIGDPNAEPRIPD